MVPVFFRAARDDTPEVSSVVKSISPVVCSDVTLRGHSLEHGHSLPGMRGVCQIFP